MTRVFLTTDGMSVLNEIESCADGKSVLAYVRTTFACRIDLPIVSVQFLKEYNDKDSSIELVKLSTH